MGGDYAPAEVVKGAMLVAREDAQTQIILVGDRDVLAEQLSALGELPNNIVVHHASERIGMAEHPVTAVQEKRDSSLVIAGLMVKSGEADATFSAGNTGAAMAFATLELGRVPGIKRPAIATTLPTPHGRTLLLDAGANPDCTPQNLMQFALLGSIYAEKALGRTNPTVGLLNIGGEAGKGNELVKATYPLLQASGLNFVGNVEGNSVFEHAADVVVCDAFAGNVLLKSAEGIAELMLHTIQRDLAALADGEAKNVLAAVLRGLVARVDHEETGGAPLLGINGVSVIGHGRSYARGIASGIRLARDIARSGFVAALRAALPTG